MPPSFIDPLSSPPSLPPLKSDHVSRSSENRRFGDLRGLRWRINLGVLSSSTNIDDLRRVTADSRRRYARLRRRLLVEPHITKDGSCSPPDLVMDNPLSQNPDSTWSHFFRNAELERMVDQDLSRLYPEHGTYFQTPGCQGMLRRILLLWCLRHPECGYRQGMHELIAPLIYVLQVDLEHLSKVRKLYEDLFLDRLDGLLCQKNDLCYSFDLRKSQDLVEDETGSHGNSMKVSSFDELDPEIQTIVLLSDAYGAEGELGVVLSEKFVEHDAYCMFDALMSHGSVATTDFFSSSPIAGSLSGLPPVIEASTALYHLLSLVDSSLHSHLQDLGVEPQYFSLRWLRILFGREFSLDNLLIIWDEIFASDNNRSYIHLVEHLSQLWL
ncbi:putative Rab-GTPase-TBC domain-containing protein [Lupinus albus]|uniref:Putative Rab-GTPase-TBC domain-containing protein n=1 Tax=Lupinus albus TaxID=3870 RepID=A0A6A4PSW2_LUPAL|nr:putative Rab-GTPase-TBC domain-containing protein [Lupinus albus]